MGTEPELPLAVRSPSECARLQSDISSSGKVLQASALESVLHWLFAFEGPRGKPWSPQTAPNTVLMDILEP